MTKAAGMETISLHSHLWFGTQSLPDTLVTLIYLEAGNALHIWYLNDAFSRDLLKPHNFSKVWVY